MSWTSRTAFDRKLIDLIRGYPILYDLRKRKPNDRERIQRIWKQIASDMNWDLRECKTRWHTIRDSFIKMHRLKDQNKAPKKSKYFVSHLRFLDTLLKHKHSSEKVKKELHSSTSGQHSVQNDKNEDVDVIGINNEHSEKLNCEVVLLEDVGSFLKTPEKIDQNEGPKCKKLKLSGTPTDIFNEHEEERLQIVPRSPVKKSEEIVPKITGETDAFDTDNPVFTFFKSMAQIVAQFPPRYIAEARIRICQCVGQMEVRALTEKK